MPTLPLIFWHGQGTSFLPLFKAPDYWINSFTQSISRCTKNMTGEWRSISSGAMCTPTNINGKPSNCYFFPLKSQTAKTSIMYLQSIDSVGTIYLMNYNSTLYRIWMLFLIPLFVCSLMCLYFSHCVSYYWVNQECIVNYFSNLN